MRVVVPTVIVPRGSVGAVGEKSKGSCKGSVFQKIDTEIRLKDTWKE